MDDRIAGSTMNDLVGRRSGTGSVDSFAKNAQNPRADYISERTRPYGAFWIALTITFVISAAYAYWCLNKGWIPQDDGTLAQSAARVLQGQLPHRDFVDNYTGGLSYLHALAFKTFGINLAALRWCVFLFFLASLPAFFYIASHFLSAIATAGLTLLAAVWTLPLYPAAMPSWYNLFFALLGAAALFRYLDTLNRRWLFIAGVFGGVSFLIKVVGLYYIAAVLLFFIFREQQINGAGNSKDVQPARMYRLFTVGGLSTFMVCVLLLLRTHRGGGEFVHFILPAGALSAVLAWHERSGGSGRNLSRFSVLFGMATPFLLGVMLPIALYLAPYALSGSLHSFYDGVFALGVSRAGGLAIKRPELGIIWCSVLPLLVISRAVFWKRDAGRGHTAFLSVALAVLLLIPTASVMAKVWASAAMLTPLIVLLGTALLLLRPSFADNLPNLRRQQLALLLSLAAVCSLIQFPCAWAIYFSYLAPLTFLALAAIISTRKQPSGRYMLGAMLVFYILFAIIRVQPANIYTAWFGDTWPAEQILRLPRAGGIKVKYREMYEDAAALITAHVRSGTLLATPECPELYFLTGMHSPTGDDQGLPSKVLLNAIDRDDVDVLVINEQPVYTPQEMTPAVQAAISSRFPFSRTIGIYRIFWKK